MEATRLIERSLFPCEELNIADYPFASECEFETMETESVDKSIIHVFPFVRKKCSKPYIEVYVYDVMLYPQACFRRFIIRDGYRMDAETEESFFAYAKEVSKDSCSEEWIAKFIGDANAAFPDWHLRRYSIGFWDRDHGLTEIEMILTHIYYASHHSGPREILFKADLYNIAFRLDKVYSYNIIGTTPSSIMNMPLKLLKIMNQRLLVDFLGYKEEVDKALRTYELYAGYMGKEIPKAEQWEYLTKLASDGTFAGHGFMRRLYNILGRREFVAPLDCYEEYITLSDSLPPELRMRLPYPDNIWDAIETLKDISYYYTFDSESDALIRDRKKQTIYDYKGEKYFVTLPANVTEFCREAISQGNCLLEYIEKHAAGETTILFLRKNDSPNKSFVTLEVQNYEITQALGRSNSLPPKDVYDFLKEYARANWLTYEPYRLMIRDMFDDEIHSEDPELKAFFAKIKVSRKWAGDWQRSGIKGHVQISLEDYFPNLAKGINTDLSDKVEKLIEPFRFSRAVPIIEEII